MYFSFEALAVYIRCSGKRANTVLYSCLNMRIGFPWTESHTKWILYHQRLLQTVSKPCTQFRSKSLSLTFPEWTDSELEVTDPNWEENSWQQKHPIQTWHTETCYSGKFFYSIPISTMYRVFCFGTMYLVQYLTIAMETSEDRDDRKWVHRLSTVT